MLLRRSPSPSFASCALRAPALAPWAAAAAFVAVSAACGGARFDGHVYVGPELSFRVGELPAHFRPIESSQSLLAFRSDETGETVALDGRCEKDGDDVPLEALTQHLFLQFDDERPLAQRRFALDGRDALRSELVAKLDGVEKHFVVVVLKKDGCVWDFLRIAPVSQRSTAGFDRFVGGFHALKPGAP